MAVALAGLCVVLLLTRGTVLYPGRVLPGHLPLWPFAALVGVLAWLGRRRPRPEPLDPGREAAWSTAADRRWWALLAAVFVVALPFWHQLGGRVEGEGISYYVYLRSWAVDGDLDFTNEYAALRTDEAEPRLMAPTPTGLPRNVHAVGPAVLWAPFFYLAGVVAPLADVPPWEQDLETGYGHARVAAAALGSILWLLLGVVLLHRELSRLAPAGAVAAGIVVALLASPLLWYAFFEPSMSHAPAAACMALAMVAWLAWRRRPTALRAVVVGLTSGLLAMQRWQLLFWVLVPLVDGLARMVRARRSHAAAGAASNARDATGNLARSAPDVTENLARNAPDAAGRTSEACSPVASGPAAADRGAVGDLVQLALVGLAALVAFVPQLLAWRVLWGSWVVNPMGGAYLDWSRPALAGVVLSTRHGLFVWHPALLLAVVGLGLACRRHRALTVAGAALLLAMWYVNASVGDWWGNDAFGQRRFAALLAVFAWGLAALLARFRRRPRRLLLVLALLVAWNAGLAHGYRTGVFPRDWWLSVGDAMAAQADAVQAASRGLLRGTSRRLPALGTPLFRLVDGHYLLSGRGLGGAVDVGDTDDGRFLGRGWDRRELTTDGVTFRWILGDEAELWLPIFYLRPHRLQIRMWPPGTLGGQEVTVLLNGTALATLPVSRPGVHTVEAPGAVWHRGLNLLSFRLRLAQPPPGPDQRPLGLAVGGILLEPVEEGDGAPSAR